MTKVFFAAISCQTGQIISTNKKRGVVITPRYCFEWMVELIGIEPTTS